MSLVEAANEENAGRYAGLIAAAFMMGRTITALLWGQVADHYGRTFVLHMSLVCSCGLSVLFGIAPTMAAAITIRFLMGFFNGIMSTLKTIVSELSQGDEKKESRMMGVVIGMWGLGFLVSPAISGAIAEPLKQYPDAAWLQKEGLFKSVLERYPFLLPNLLGAIMCFISTILIATFVPETLPGNTKRNPRYMLTDMYNYILSWLPSKFRYQQVRMLKSHESDVEMMPDDDNDEFDNGQYSSTEQSSPLGTMAAIWQRKSTRQLLWIYWAYSFLGLTIDEAFPLFCMSQTAGFGLSEKEIGKVLTLLGFIFIVCQYVVCNAVYDRLGLLGAVRLGASISAPAMLLLPIATLLNSGADHGKLTWSAFLYLGGTMALYRIFSFVFFTSISVMANRTVPASQRASMNGLSVFGGSFVKSAGPIIAGFLVANSVSLLGRYASLMIFGVIGLYGSSVAICTFLLLHQQLLEDVEEDQEQTASERSEEAKAISIEHKDVKTTLSTENTVENPVATCFTQPYQVGKRP